MSVLQATRLVWLVWLAYWIVVARLANKAVRGEPDIWRALHLLVVTACSALVFMPWLEVGFLGARFVPDLPALGYVGLALTVLGLGIAVWARRHLGAYWSGRVTISEGHLVIRTGPYARVRHPIYAGALLALLGTVLTVGEVRGLIALLVLVPLYWVKVRKEETLLTRELGDEYAAYKREVRAIIPFRMR